MSAQQCGCVCTAGMCAQGHLSREQRLALTGTAYRASPLRNDWAPSSNCCSCFRNMQRRTDNIEHWNKLSTFSRLSLGQDDLALCSSIVILIHKKHLFFPLFLFRAVLAFSCRHQLTMSDGRPHDC